MRTAVAASVVAFCIVCVRVFPANAFGAPTMPPAAGAVPDGLGVNIHFVDPRPGEMEILAGAGFTWVRMDFGWEATERTAGQYDFSPYDRLLATLARHHLRAVLILDYSNRLYDDGLSPHTDEGRAAFARWAAAAAVHFKGRGVLWETWNEPNINQFWKPKPSADDYAKLALATAKAIHEAAPDESVAGSATSRVDLPFLETCFAAGLLEHWSAVTVHPYRQEDPETAAADYRKVRELMAKYAPKGKPLPPVVSGEWGYSSGWKKFDEAKQGKMLPREWLTNLSEEIPLSIWYDWHDDGSNPKEPEHHFGTVRYEYHEGRDLVYAPKPAYLAARTLTTALEGFHFVRRVDVGTADDYVLRFENGDKIRLVAWTRASEQRAVTVPAADAPAGRYAVTGHTGDKLQATDATAAGLKVTLTDAPQYLARK